MTAMLPRIRSADERAELQELVRSLRQFEDPHYCWKGSTQGGAITSIEVLRQTSRGKTAFVKVALRLADGRVRVERVGSGNSGTGIPEILALSLIP
jgi:hypothetical protein